MNTLSRTSLFFSLFFRRKNNIQRKHLIRKIHFTTIIALAILFTSSISFAQNTHHDSTISIIDHINNDNEATEQYFSYSNLQQDFLKNSNQDIQGSDGIQINVSGRILVLIIEIKDLRMDKTEVLSWDIWVNYSFIIRPIIYPPDAGFLHQNANGSLNIGILFWSRIPYRFSIGTISVDVTVGDTTKNVNGKIIWPFFLLEDHDSSYANMEDKT